MASVTYDEVTKEFEETVAVQSLDLDIADGEFLVLVGPSGCGKSTALRMLAGLEEISDGRIVIGERVVNNVPPGERDVAMVFQSYALYPQMTVYDNLAFGLYNQKVPKDDVDRRVREAARILELDQLLARKPKQLSGGQRQRVALGRAIVREPAVFLMDEPLSNLDAKLRVQMRADIAKLQRELGTTTIYVTHDQVEAMTMGDQIAVMRAGELQQVGTPQELYTTPRNVFVARFIGSPSMNIVTAERNGSTLRYDGFEAQLPDRVASSLSADGAVVGFRPEHLRLANGAGQPGDVRIPATVDVVEYLGDEQLVHLHAGDVDIIAKLPIDQQTSAGEEVTLTLPASRLHLFDRATEEAIDVAA